ncbi:hypothetical protein HYDPIDRAFT_114531 [Hydnomerulius pinastri MD-312]|uniref:Secreted protein n=1 Tax=Hydnomerulius pinastri MD-312 TaxID=994086 RepID=A0A0C9WDE9_9AGAM|nr:hypothetical protein HYDPIDRAFT_114531 [Hydnomerulius pinastri MD-312]
MVGTVPVLPSVLLLFVPPGLLPTDPLSLPHTLILTLPLQTKSAYEVAGVVGTKDDGTEDLGAAAMWAAHGHQDVDLDGVCVNGDEGRGRMWR